MANSKTSTHNTEAKKILRKLIKCKFDEDAFLNYLSFGKEHHQKICKQELNQPSDTFSKFSECISKQSEISELLKRYQIEKYENHFYFLLFYSCSQAHPKGLEVALTKKRDSTGNLKQKYAVAGISDLEEIKANKIDRITFRIKHKESFIKIDNPRIISEIVRLISEHTWRQSNLGPTHIIENLDITGMPAKKVIAEESFNFFKSITKSENTRNQQNKNKSEILAAWVLYLTGRIILSDGEISDNLNKIANERKGEKHTQLDKLLQQKTKGCFKKSI